ATPPPPPSPQSSLAVDVVQFAEGAGPQTMSAFSTLSPGDLIVVFASSDGPSNAAQTLNVTSNKNLTWSLANRANAQAGTSEVWFAKASGLVNNLQVTVRQSRTGYRES